MDAGHLWRFLFSINVTSLQWWFLIWQSKHLCSTTYHWYIYNKLHIPTMYYCTMCVPHTLPKLQIIKKSHATFHRLIVIDLNLRNFILTSCISSNDNMIIDVWLVWCLYMKGIALFLLWAEHGAVSCCDWMLCWWL